MHLLFFLLALTITHSLSDPERSALLQFKSATQPDPLSPFNYWTGAHHHCTWPGVACDSSLHVTSLSFPAPRKFKVRGKLTASLLNLTALKTLSFPHHSLHGHIPQGIFNLQNLEVLELEGNELSGNISLVKGFSKKLRILNLSGNFISGDIPEDIFGIQNLEVLDLQGNGLSGNFSLVKKFSKRLKILNLGGNFISGEIPDALLGCVNLERLDFSGNMIGGVIPGYFGKFSKLQVLDLSRNFLAGWISESLGNCSELKYLVLGANNLSGAIPSEIGRLKKMRVFDVSKNRLSGLVPMEIGDCVELSVIVLTNYYDSMISGDFLNFVGNDEYNYNSSKFIGYDENNYFQGKISVKIVSLPKLRILWAPRANLEGSFPENWGACLNLEMVNLGENHFMGDVPVSFEKCKKLKFLNLSSNYLTGRLSDTLHLSCMSVFDVSNNKLSGMIPRFIYIQCPQSPYQQDHDLTALYSSYFVYTARKAITMSQLHGKIPSLFSELNGLNYLNLARNNITGEIPTSLATLKNLIVFLINNNRLYGKIPSIFADMTSLSMFDASFNNLSGPLPINASALKCESVLGNPLLESCNASYISIPPSHFLRLTRSLEPNPEPSPVQSIFRNVDGRFSAVEIASITSAAAIVAILFALLVIYIYTRRCIPGSAHVSFGIREIITFVNIGVELTYEKVLEATGNFNPSNCIGSGGFGATYRAEVASGVIVAIKRLSAGRIQGVQQLHAEVKTLGGWRHQNLVTLIGYHIGDVEMFLVYNYLPGGDLENFIEERNSRHIDWRTLHKIALQIAKALNYLHEHCIPRIVHRDVKPSNILLDNDFNAYLSDFGLARLLGSSESHATTGVAGTFGYVAPEYALTCRVSDKSDVYSYGVVLLELISSKKALDPSFSSYGNGFNIVAWACMLLDQDRASEFFLEGLWNVAPHDDLVETMRLGVRCTYDSLNDRPMMYDVMTRLKRLQPPP